VKRKQKHDRFPVVMTSIRERRKKKGKKKGKEVKRRGKYAPVAVAVAVMAAGGGGGGVGVGFPLVLIREKAPVQKEVAGEPEKKKKRNVRFGEQRVRVHQQAVMFHSGSVSPQPCFFFCL